MQHLYFLSLFPSFSALFLKGTAGLNVLGRQILHPHLLMVGPIFFPEYSDPSDSSGHGGLRGCVVKGAAKNKLSVLSNLLFTLI